ncbi:MAG: TonB family protein [Prevotella sp.]|nr:TonB family protein [Prevotella sp.]MBQ9642252.1 TonB family protein [Bacteroidaceae bacterium]
MNKEHTNELEFAQIEKRLRPRLMLMGREFFGSDTEAEEVVQETWLRAWNVRGRVELTDAYILRIARNVCVNMWRGHRTQVELVDEDSTAITEVTPQEEAEERENSEWLQSRLQRLPQAEREVWQMFYDEGLTVDEIAEARGITVGTVRKTISNVRSILRTELRRRFFTPRQLMSIIIFALALGLAVASALNPNGVVRGAIEHVLGIPEDTTIYEFDEVEVMPSYPGDTEALWTFMKQNLHYPESAEADNIQGRVVVQFVVEKDGSLTGFKILYSRDARLNEEALRILRIMPHWQPAQLNGRPVRSHFCIPVVFLLK